VLHRFAVNSIVRDEGRRMLILLRPPYRPLPRKSLQLPAGFQPATLQMMKSAGGPSSSMGNQLSRRRGLGQ
jgi:hypothetical protein